MLTTGMLNNWIWLVAKRMDGRAVASQFGSKAKNIENLLQARVANSRMDMADYFDAYLDNLPPPFGKIDEATRQALIEELIAAAQDSGPLSLFFIGQKIAGSNYPQATKLAHEFDALSVRLDDAKTNDSIPAFITALLDANFLTDDYWRCPSTETDMRLELCETDDWAIVQTVIVRLRHNCILSIVALWDLEFCASAFDRFELLPLLLHLAPKIKSGLTVRPGNTGAEITFVIPKGYKGFGDLIDRPMSLLVDVNSCLLYYREHHRWPERSPTVAKSAEILGTTQQKLAKLRSSRHRMTATQYQLLLNSKKLGVGDLMPLLAAAHIWECLLFPQSSGKGRGEKKAMIPDEGYLHFWKKHKAALEARGYVFDGNIPWPSFWARPPISLDRPADDKLC